MQRLKIRMRIQNLKMNSKSKQPEDDGRFDRNVLEIRDLLTPDGFEETKDYIYLGAEKYVRTFVVSVWPREIHVGWFDDIFSLGDIDLSIYVDPVPDRIVAKKLRDRLISVMTELYRKEKDGDISYVPQLMAMKDDLERELTDVQTNRDKMFYVTAIITLKASNLEELENKTNMLEDIFARKAARIRVATFMQAEGFKGSLPMCKPALQMYERNITTGGVASLFPISNPDLTHPDGILLGRNYFTGAPVFINNFAVPYYLNNQHIAIFGIPGAGKSVAVKHILFSYILIGKKVVVIDPEKEYRKLIEGLGGEYIEIKSGVEAGMNPFDLEVDVDEYGNETVDIQSKVSEIKGLLGAISRNFNGRPLNALELVAVEQSILELYKERNITSNPESLYEEGGRKIGKDKYAIGKVKKRMPTLSDLRKKLAEKKNSQELAEILIPFTRGHSMGMFDCETSIDTKSHIIGFSFFDIKDEFTKFYATYVLLAWIWQNFVQRQRDIDKIVANDEAWMFVKYPEAAQFLNDLARRGRKHHTALIVSSQFIDEFLENENGQAVIKSCATNILMRQHPASVDKTVEFFHLSSGTKNLLESFSQGECILSLNGNVTAIKVTPIACEWPYITT
ncbi:AAA-like domain-containing protein [Caldanaerobius fijiensis DSM 17918]|uniref:AAA-like domain-containing protein n=1 Tax=Caldanaerobius fijiensis DSM 17918 TaxID=1121256 RepID=A0A1M5BMD6_9THEO|nr:ATP-binding protein [Caldanaerobius fijiensis]SHF43671.1 AAA-like domain-containing protein [Caldanaerobius fijiensis DSM 17918]